MEEEVKTNHILVKDTIGSAIAVTTENGDKVYESINKVLAEGRIVELNFEGITLMITAFLNPAIGRLYESYTSDFLNKHLKLINVDPTDRGLFKKVVQRAKEYFLNKKETL